MKTRTFKPYSTLLVCALIAGCASSPPRPDSAAGDVNKANTQPEVLAELIEIARAGAPRRYKAERNAEIQETLQAWAKTAGLTLNWNTSQRPMTSGIVDEVEIRAALMALATQFRSDQAALIFEFTKPKTLRVSDVISTDQGCAIVPAGAIALGRFCISPHIAPASESPPALADLPAPTPAGQTALSNGNPSTQPPKEMGLAATHQPTKQKEKEKEIKPIEQTAPKRLSISAGQRLSIALGEWLLSQKIDLIWDVAAPGDRIRDIEMLAAWRAPTEDVEQTLAELLPNFGLRAVVQADPHTVIVRSTAGSTNKTHSGAPRK